MRAETRHQLKEDKFSRATIGAAEATVHWTVEHQSKLIAAAIAAVVLIAIAAGGWYYLNQQDAKASADLGAAVRTMDAPVVPAGTPAEPGMLTFSSSKDRSTAARQQLQSIVEKYPHTRSADFARYFLGLTSAQLGDNPAAEADLQRVASSSNADLSALAKMALASVYRSTNRPKQAIDIYNQLIAKPTLSVGKTTAQLELAATYQASQQPLDAKRTYEQIQKENPATEVAQIATQKLQELK